MVGLTHAAVRRRWLAPFGWWPRFVRRMSDPLVQSLERRLAAGGQNPQDAPLWLLGAAAVAGLFAIMLVRWLFGAAGLLLNMSGQGPVPWARLLVAAVSWLLMTAILVRVVGRWLGFGSYRRVMRPFYRLTDWLIEPIRHRLSPMRGLDLSPFVAYLLLFVLRELLLGLIR